MRELFDGAEELTRQQQARSWRSVRTLIENGGRRVLAGDRSERRPMPELYQRRPVDRRNRHRHRESGGRHRRRQPCLRR